MTDAVEAAALALLGEALDQPAGRRAGWITASGAAGPVRARALTLLGHAAAGDQLNTGGGPLAARAAPLPERIGAYRVTGLIGTGGMGAVYRGQRATGDFEHEVAIKVVRPGALADTLVERFQAERQTLARLSHPNIARLFDGGATEAGEPYIVMELIAGVTLDRWLADDPDRAARTRLFLQVCSAAGFAHQNLIVHRDITPPNVLVDRDGAPKLIDFGISRRAGISDGGAVAGPAGAISFTPGFAAPERRAGGPATTLGDVYSLGRLLERLLPPGRDRDLAAIVARATAAQPEDRYPSVDALAGDVVAWRDRRPVAARGVGALYVARRFADRHRLAVAAAGLAVVALAVGIAAIIQANVRAERSRALAEVRFNQTRGIARTLLFDSFDQVSRLPGSTRARVSLASAGLSYIDALAADREAPFDVRVEAGLGYARLAEVIGSGQEGTLGKLADGTALLGKAVAILRRAYRERPGDPAARRAYALVLLERAGVRLYNDNDIAGARIDAASAYRLTAGAARHDPEAARIAAASMQTLADSRGWDDDWAGARPLLLAAERFIDGLPAATRDAKPLQLVRSAVLRLLGEADHKLKQEAEARVALDRAVAINEALLAADPGDPLVRRRVATSNWYRAVVHRTAKRDALAADSIARAVAAAKVLRDGDPNDEASAHLWAVVSEVQAQVLMDLGKRDEAFALNERLTLDIAGWCRCRATRPACGAASRRRCARSAATIMTAAIMCGRAPPGANHARCSAGSRAMAG